MPISRALIARWGYPLVPLVFVTGSIGLVLNTLLERPAESMAGLLLMAAGLPAYAYWRRKRIRLSAGLGT